MPWRDYGTLAPAGQTGNNTHASVPVDGYEAVITLAVLFLISAIGATPTITWKVQGSLEGPEVTDANSNWFDIEGLANDSTSEALTVTKTAVGAYEESVEIARRPVRKIRLVTSANTNVTYGPVTAWADVSAE